MKFSRNLLVAAILGATATAASADVLFWSQQGGKVEEAQAIRDSVITGSSVAIDFQSPDEGAWFTRLEAELKSGEGTIGMVGALHGVLSGLNADDFVDLSDVDLGGVTVVPSFMELGKLGTEEQKYLPWMQATYVMAANKKALEHLPEGADINALTYDQLVAWSKTMAEETGSPKFGFPAGPKGLKHRFFQGYLYPSYTNSMVTKFRSAEAVAAWEKFKELWEYTNPASTSYDSMQDPLKAGDVWVAFDHTARLADAFNSAPDDFIAFPAPAGPTGRGFMPVLVGLAIPKTAPNMDEAKAALSHMMKHETQLATLAAVNFFPVVNAEIGSDSPAAAQLSGSAIATMSSSEDANPGLLPIGLGELGGKFSQTYTDAFERIILAGQPIQEVLDEQAETLRGIMDEAAAPCWAPDPDSDGACPVD